MVATQLTNELSDAMDTSVSSQIVYRRVNKAGLYARRPMVWIPLTVDHKGTHMNW